ncbi:MAG: hypothetical protein Q8R28_01095, partial [Dehalococcoidia bacterium]|nr:hypothetical protein [Dehalococcoidia bacterium]
PLPADIPILGQAVKKFTCKQGHAYQGPQAMRLYTNAAADQTGKMVQQGMQGPPMCMVCFLDYVGFMFPQWPEGMTIEEAVEKGVLNERVLPKEVT